MSGLLDVIESGSAVGEQLRETTSRLFGDFVSPRLLAGAEAGEWPEAAWSAVQEAGLTMALVPEDAGGFGVAVEDGLSILRIAGANALPLPLAESMLAGWLLAGAGFEVPDGVVGVATGTDVSMARSGDKWRLSGTLEGVSWGRRVDAMAVLAMHDGSPLVALIRTQSWKVVPDQNIAREPRDTLIVDDADADVAAAAPGIGWPELRAAGAVTRSLMIAGALSTMSAMTVQYAQERVQFGRTIGKFQAVQQNLAVLAGQAAAAAAAADLGAEAMASGLSLPKVAVAKCRTSEAAGIASAIAHQVHGAIGFTYEHRLHFYTKRVLGWRNEYGTETSWSRVLGQALVDGGPDDVWSTLTGL